MKDSNLAKGYILKGTDYTYRIEGVLGQGSFGIIYLATTKIKAVGGLGSFDTEIKVAVKEFFMHEFCSRHADGAVTEMSAGSLVSGYARKFRKEAENLARLSHPGIVKVLEVFDANSEDETVVVQDTVREKTRLTDQYSETERPNSFSPSTRCTHNGHEWVDLGLSVKWATCNVGATTASDYGSYFAWGETSPKSDYSWENLKYRTGGDSTKTSSSRSTWQRASTAPLGRVMLRAGMRSSYPTITLSMLRVSLLKLMPMRMTC